MKWCAIASYRPKPGMEEELRGLLREHLPLLCSLDLATDSAALIMRAEDGTIIEIFEWKSAEAKKKAHRNAKVKKLWDRFEARCEFPCLAELSEAAHPFAAFESVRL